MKKPDYKLRLTDLIPNNIGTLNYVNRNQDNDLDDGEKVALRGIALFYGNATLFIGVGGLAIWKGLELLLN